jgi:TatD DNase family protein
MLRRHKRLAASTLLLSRLSSGFMAGREHSLAAQHLLARLSSSTSAAVAGAAPVAKPSTASYLVDVDANLCHEALSSSADEHIQLAQQQGVEQFVVPGSTVVDSEASLALSRTHPDVIYSTAGVHPYNVKDCGDISSAMQALRYLAADPLVTCVGECGLDYSEGFPEAALQQPWFEQQVRLACQIRKPLFLHERLAFEPFVATLRSADATTPEGLPPCLVHCFTGTEQELLAYIEMGFYIGLTGFLLKKPHGDALRECVKHIPLDKLMIETDAVSAR